MLALDAVWQEHEPPQGGSYMPENKLVIGWFLQVRMVNEFTWATLVGCVVVLVQALGDYIDVVLKNFALHIVHMFMH